jgi:hypothetical protein
MHVSQLMQIDMSISSGGFCHFGFRWRVSMRSALVAAPAVTSIAATVPPAPRSD